MVSDNNIETNSLANPNNIRSISRSHEMKVMAMDKEMVCHNTTNDVTVTRNMDRLEAKVVPRGGEIEKCLVLAVIMLVFQFSLFAARHKNFLFTVSNCNNLDLLPQNFNSSLAYSNGRRLAMTPSSAPVEVSTLSSFKVENPLSWTDPWTGMQFYKYKEAIDRKIQIYHQEQEHRVDKILPTCYNIPLYSGEFGYELAGMVPWAYYKSQQRQHNMKVCQGVKTHGRPGTKYLYYFSKEHKIKSAKMGEPQRKSHRLPRASPFGKSPHFGNTKFPTQEWLAPPYKEFFRRHDIETTAALDNKPLLILSNKYTMEWSGGPVNHIPIDTLREILKLLSPHYHIVYNRFADSRLEDELESQINNKNNGNSTAAQEPYGDKQMIRRFFPSVVLFEELSQILNADDVNLLMLSLGATAEKFVSVQGGNAVVNSFFGGTNVIYCVKGPEVNYKSEHGGDFSYYHKFSNSTIKVVRNAKELQNAIRKHIVM